MREILLAFVLALVVGSIINGWPQQPQTPPHNPDASAQTNSPRRDFPDFNTFLSLDDTNFADSVLGSQKPVFVICYVPNNLSCDRMIPLVAAMAQEQGDAILVARLDAANNTSLAQKYEIHTVPTYLVFNKGQLTARMAGVVTKDQLETMIKP